MSDIVKITDMKKVCCVDAPLNEGSSPSENL